MDEDEDDYDDLEDEGEVSECGAYGAEDDIEAWQRCGMAGTEYCDFECDFAAHVRRLLREREASRTDTPQREDR